MNFGNLKTQHDYSGLQRQNALQIDHRSLFSAQQSVVTREKQNFTKCMQTHLQKLVYKEKNDPNLKLLIIWTLKKNNSQEIFA